MSQCWKRNEINIANNKQLLDEVFLVIKGGVSVSALTILAETLIILEIMKKPNSMIIFLYIASLKEIIKQL